MSLFALIAFALVLGALAWAWLASLRRSLNDDGRLRLREVLVRHGRELPSDADAAGIYRTALATRRCVHCAEKERCDVWLARGERNGLGAFCPNADFVERIARAA